MKKKILITGAAGFIGSHLFNYFSKKNYDVIGIDNFDRPCGAKVDCVKGDVRDFELVDELVKKADVVYHLAAQTNVDRSYKEKKLTRDTNINGTRNILEACKKHGKKMVFASTSEVYGTAKTSSISEEHELNPQSPYAVSKKEAEDLCRKYYELYGTEVVILRNFNTFGPYQNKNFYGAVIPVFFKRVLKEKPPEVYLPGSQTRDFMYIEDAVQAYETASEKAPLGKPINFGSGEEISILNLAKKIIKLENLNLNPVFIEGRPNEVMRLKADITKAKKLGFSPKVSLDEGLKRYGEWIKSKNK